jgi:hypothetical protein
MSHKHLKSNVAVLLKTSSLQITVVAKFSLSDALELGKGGVGENSCILHTLPFYVNLYWLLGRNKLLIYKTLLKTNLDLRNTTLGHGFHFHHRNPRMFSIKSFVHDSGRTLVCAEYGYQKGSPYTNS